MSETTTSGVAPATDANRDWEQFVPQGTRENYAQMARDAADINGTSAHAELAKMADSFDQQHKTDPTGGWNHLAAWARTADPELGTQPDPVAVARSQAIESARRDPKPALTSGDPEVAAAALESLEAQSSSTATATADPSFGVVPNTGPLAVDVSTDVGADDQAGEVTYADGSTSDVLVDSSAEHTES